MVELRKTTPIDVTSFEREQLRFFLSRGDMTGTLTELNPSLAWLPLFVELQLLQNDAALPLWIERNFDSLDAVSEVVANIRFFKAESATILQHRLNSQRDKIDPLAAKCWQLIIRHVHNAQQGALQNEWFELLPRIKREEFSSEVLNRIAQTLTPKLTVDKRYGWYDEPNHKIEKPTDVLSVKYRVDDISENDFFVAWPKQAPAVTEDALIQTLTGALSRSLADATDVGVEDNNSLSISDVDVPSVATHEQNAYREGFLPIVRVTAELWSRLLRKDSKKARNILASWQKSEFRLIHRLALYAAADPKISSKLVAEMLTSLPQGELFLTNSQVEVHRLIRARWGDLSTKQRASIERRVIAGPPAVWFREGADISSIVDRVRFEHLLNFERSKMPLGKATLRLLQEIRKRHPRWRSPEPEKVGFTMWHGSVSRTVGNKDKLSSIPPKKLIGAAKKVAAKADFMDGDAWQGLAQSDPFKAFQGIESASAVDRWHQWAWRPVLWAATKLTDPNEVNRIGRLLAKWPRKAPFDEVASGAAFWMDEVSAKLSAPTLWSIWDLVEKRSPRRAEDIGSDAFTTSLNDAAGHLATVLIKRTPKLRSTAELNKQLRARYFKLIESNDASALLARIRLSAAVAFLFERAPKWTAANLLRSYDWSSADAPAMWSARKYSSHIGSPKLFELTKAPFLDLFVRPDTPDEDLRAFAEWLAAVLLANQGGTPIYPLTALEVRSALRRSGKTTLWSFAHRLATSMSKAPPSEKVRVWRETVGPVFRGAWPLDAEMQTPHATFKLVQILLGTGVAFGEAAAEIIPFIRAEDPRGHSSVFSLSEANEALYGIDSAAMLNLLSAVTGDAPERSVYGLSKALNKLEAKAPDLVQTKSFQKMALQAAPF